MKSSKTSHFCFTGQTIHSWAKFTLYYLCPRSDRQLGDLNGCRIKDRHFTTYHILIRSQLIYCAFEILVTRKLSREKHWVQFRVDASSFEALAWNASMCWMNWQVRHWFLNALFTIGNGSSPSIRRRILFTTSLISKLGILQDQPVPIPSAPFISTIGMIGIYHSGSTRWLSSYRNLRTWSSIGGNTSRASGLEWKKDFKPEFSLLSYSNLSLCFHSYFHIHCHAFLFSGMIRDTV